VRQASGLRLQASGLTVLLAACGPKPGPATPVGADAVLFVKSNVSDAQIWVDGRLVGPLNVVRGGIAVDPGRHRIELRRDDYFSRYVELDLAKGVTQKLQLEMAPVLP
jgi:hypothetical protein